MLCSIAFLLSPGEASSTFAVNSTSPLAYVGWDKGDTSSLVHAPEMTSFSFTDSFLRAVRLLAATADEPPPPDEPTSPQEDHDSDAYMDIDIDFDNLDALTAFPGDQHWWLFRPDPRNLGRRESLDLWVTAATSMLEIETQIVRVWPDLQPGNPNWRIIYANNLAFDSLMTPISSDSSAFIVKATMDEPPNPIQHSVILLSLRTWIPHLGHAASSSLRAFVVDMQTTVHEIFDSIDFHQRCDGAPCPFEINGQVLTAWHHDLPIRLFDGDFLLFHATTHLAELFPITADQTGQGIPALDELPPEFQNSVVRQMPDRAEADELVLLACRAQQAFTSWARDIFDLTQMRVLHTTALAVFTLEADQLVFMRFVAPLPLDVYQLYFSIVEYMLDGEEQNWQFVPIQLAASAFLDPRAQHLAIRQADRFEIYDVEVVCLIELRIATDDRGSARYQSAEHYSRYLPPTLDPQDLYASVNVDTLCQEEDCSCVVDGTIWPAGTRIQLLEGSFVQIFVGNDEDSPNTTMVLDEENCEALSDPTAATEGSFLQADDFEAASSQSQSFAATSRARPRLLGLSNWWVLWMISHRASFFLLATYLLVPSVERIGEAMHPGPEIWIGTSNPSGLRGKEETYFGFPQGIWGISETHLTAMNQRDAHSAMRRLSTTYSRSLQWHHGAPIAPRSARSTTGTWSGVSVAADLPCRPLHVPWPQSEYSLGRIQLFQTWCGPFQMTGANVYGWPQSPTWPRAKEATESMLTHLTTELVLSRTGPRFVICDFNCKVEESPSVNIWKAHGWLDVQEWAFQHHGRIPTMTSKQSTILDHVFISPELVTYLREVSAWPVFADHTSIGACFQLPVAQIEQTVWPMPAYIPYEKVDRESWHQAASEGVPVFEGTVDEQFGAFCQAYEQSFHHHIDLPGQKLTPAMRGRGQTLRPEVRPQQCPILRPSRPGEVHPSSDLLGRSVHKWFLQLRRLQSMLHAVKAGKTTWDAQIYRAELWRAIGRAKGFEGTFASWWRTRPIQCHGSPQQWPWRVPHLTEMQCIFYDFEANYRSFEAWHAQQRSALLQLSLQENHSKLFAMVKPAAKAPLQHLESKAEVAVLETSEDRLQLHIEHPLSIDSSCDVDVDGIQVSVIQTDGPVLTLQQPLEDLTNEVLTVTRHFSTAHQIHEHLAAFWKQRWWKTVPTEADWNRIFDFCRAYVPAQPEHHVDITAEQWHDINMRYGTKSARGPDGFARRDLQWMPQSFQDSLVHQLNQWESQAVFPRPLCTGFAHPLPKRQDSCKVNDFRPVIIFSMIYRSWSSLRARQILHQVKQVAGSHQFGFLPQKENTEIWMVLQAWIEDASLAQEPLAGFVSDIEKAFEFLPRAPVLWLAQRIGISRKVIGLWDYFLTNMERRFHVAEQIGDPLLSNSGFPEGCGMSCVAMALVNVVFHLYMDAYSQVTALSFVDNLELLGRGSVALHEGALTMQAWAEMWHLQLDMSKSYIWANTASLRKECQALGWDTKTHAKDLGAPMTYGSKHSVVDQVERIASLRPLWPLLRRLRCTPWQKQRLLYQAFYLLAVLSSPVTDPGFYQFWQVLITFQRVAQKQPGFVDLWLSFMQKFQGENTYGPFGKLLEVCGQVGWQVQPPCLIDHDGIRFNLVTVDRRHLEDTAIDGWRQGVAYAFSQRKDVQELTGIDWRVLHAVFQNLPGHKREALHVLQEGAFLESRVHCKYDLSKTGRCKHCGAEDTMLHRSTVCPARQSLYAKYPTVMAQWHTLPSAFFLRLLPSRNPHEAPFKRLMQECPDRTICLKSLRQSDHLDLFTDGSCKDPALPWASVGAWAVVSATHDLVVARGCLSGLFQTSDLAELKAIAVALDYAICNRGTTTLWTDSAFAAEGVHRLLTNPEDKPDGRYADQWTHIQMTLRGHEPRITIQHVPAHVTVGVHCQDTEDWTARWNDRVDHEAATAHGLRDSALEMERSSMLQHYYHQKAWMVLLTQFHADLADSSFVENTEEVIDEDEADTGEGAEGLDGRRLALQHDPWQRGLPEATPADGQVVKLADRFGWLFTRSMIAWLQGQASAEAAVAFQMSYLELAVHLSSGQVSTNLPVPDPARKLCWVDATTLPAALVSRPTVAAVLRLLQNFFAAVGDYFDFGLHFVDRLDLTSLGAFTPQRGVTLLLDRATIKKMGQELAAYTLRRPVRRAVDLTRPVR